MKFAFRLALPLLLALPFARIQAQTANPDALVQRAFAALKERDEKGYIALYPNGPQMKLLMQAVMMQALQSADVKKAMAADPNAKALNVDSLMKAQLNQMTTPQAQEQMRQKFSQSFYTVLKNGEIKGVNWKEAEFLSISLDSSVNDKDEDQRMFAAAGIKTAKGVVDFRSGDVDYQMNFDKLLYLPSEGGWFGSGFKQVIRKGDKFDAEAQDAKPTAEAKPDVTSPAKPKAKTKTSATKAKTKTKS